MAQPHLQPTPPPLPTVFVSHGAPLFAIEPGSSGPALRAWGSTLPADLRAVVVMSPHWMTPRPTVMSTPQPDTWHDFGGFPQALYALHYPAPGHPALAAELVSALQAAGLDALADAKRPLDHGAWVPLRHLLPQAQVPVVQVALPRGFGPREVYAMGQALAHLRHQSVLVLGSGSMTHNLAEFFGEHREAAPYVGEFSRWVERRLVAGDTEALWDYRSRAPHALRAHPSEDHFLPLFFALGAAGAQARPHYLSWEVMYSILAMDSFTLQYAPAEGGRFALRPVVFAGSPLLVTNDCAPWKGHSRLGCVLRVFYALSARVVCVGSYFFDSNSCC
jgi:4,5-DOPA dioxygenase extradiol